MRRRAELSATRLCVASVSPRRQFVCGFAGLLVSASTLSSQASAISLSPEQRIVLLNEAQRAFDRGAEMRVNDPDQAISVFREAADKFQLIVDSGIRNGRLYYNLANARLESGRLGRAIADYRRAQRLLPNDGRVEHNLSYARSLRRDQIEFTGRQAFLETLFFWHYHTSSSLRFTSALACYLLFWLLLIARTFFRQWRWRYLLLPTLVLWLILGCSVAVDMHAQAAYSGGVLTADNVIVRKGNGEGFEPQFKQTLNEGVEFSVLERRGDWLHIELPDGKTGWIRADQAEII